MSILYSLVAMPDAKVDTNEMATKEFLELPPLDEEGSVLFYWLDVFEDSHHLPGKVYLFGKVTN